MVGLIKKKFFCFVIETDYAINERTNEPTGIDEE